MLGIELLVPPEKSSRRSLLRTLSSPRPHTPPPHPHLLKENFWERYLVGKCSPFLPQDTTAQVPAPIWLSNSSSLSLFCDPLFWIPWLLHCAHTASYKHMLMSSAGPDVISWARAISWARVRTPALYFQAVWFSTIHSTSLISNSYLDAEPRPLLALQVSLCSYSGTALDYSN